MSQNKILSHRQLTTNVEENSCINSQASFVKGIKKTEGISKNWQVFKIGESGAKITGIIKSNDRIKRKITSDKLCYLNPMVFLLWSPLILTPLSESHEDPRIKL